MSLWDLIYSQKSIEDEDIHGLAQESSAEVQNVSQRSQSYRKESTHQYDEDDFIGDFEFDVKDEHSDSQGNQVPVRKRKFKVDDYYRSKPFILFDEDVLPAEYLRAPEVMYFVIQIPKLFHLQFYRFIILMSWIRFASIERHTIFPVLPLT